MGHCRRRGCISSISPCYTNIFKMFLWIKFIVRQRAETDNLPFTAGTQGLQHRRHPKLVPTPKISTPPYLVPPGLIEQSAEISTLGY